MPRREFGDMNQVRTEDPVNIRRHPTKFRHPGDLVPGICAPIFKTAVYLYLFRFSLNTSGPILGHLSPLPPPLVH